MGVEYVNGCMCINPLVEKSQDGAYLEEYLQIPANHTVTNPSPPALIESQENYSGSVLPVCAFALNSACVGDRKSKCLIMSYEANQESYLADCQADLDMFLSQRNWKDAQAVIDSVREQGYENEANIMRKSYLRAQDEFLTEVEKERKEKAIRGIHEGFMDALDREEPEDPRDVADRNQ